MGKVLITGRSGFIAGAVRRRMEKAGMHAEQISLRDSDWKRLDFSDVDAIVHTAALVHRKESEHPLEEYRQVNRDLTLELAQKAKESGVRQFVFLSTMAVYGVKISCFRAVQVDEHTQLHPYTKYGIAKLEAEEGLKALESDTFHVCVIRPPFVYGPNCRGNYGVLRKLTLKIGVIPKLKNRKSILYVENLAEFIYGVVERELSGVYCPQNEQIVSTWEIASNIAKWNHKHVFISSIFSIPVKLASLVIGKFRTAFGSEYYDPALANKCGFSYQAVDFAESICQTEANWKKD